MALVEPWGGFGEALGWLCWSLEVALGLLWVPNRLPTKWLCGGLGVALGWLCTPESMPSIWLWGGFGWLSATGFGEVSLLTPAPSVLYKDLHVT